MQAIFRRAVVGYEPHAVEDAFLRRERWYEACTDAVEARTRTAQECLAAGSNSRPPTLGASPGPGDDAPPALGPFATAVRGYKRADVEAYADWVVCRQQAVLAECRLWLEASEQLAELAAQIRARRAALQGGRMRAPGFGEAWLRWASGDEVDAERASPALNGAARTDRPSAFVRLDQRLALAQLASADRAGAELPPDTAEDVRTVAAHILSPEHQDSPWLASVLGQSPVRWAFKAPGLRLLSRDGRELGRACAIHLQGFPPRPLAIELATVGPGSETLAVAAADVAMVQSDRLRLREGARIQPLHALATPATATSGETQATPAARRETDAGPLDPSLRPVVVIIGPADGFDAMLSIAEALDEAPRLTVDFRLFRDGMYRLDGRTTDRMALAAWLERLPGVASVALDGDTLHVSLAEGAA